MEIKTNSGYVYLNKNSHYCKWLQGWIAAGAWSGWATLKDAWSYARDKKPDGCSWYAYGLLMAREQGRGYELAEKEMRG